MDMTRRAVILSGSAAFLMTRASPSPASALAWQARHGMDSQHFQTTFDSLVSQGYPSGPCRRL